ncbi:thioredoxin-like 1-2, chloroplastic isoform X2 [Andrographis paniculata]|uniref:thioredoxin-like 1-2, chloroplastic isoform X2 n=3 Tax=Andrographis paniculata TaxID=175694 RepID=UPI0021E6F589|nr:thioredoxin-like 1-2, chloroplastic isoform X2 [Andrographis paniculata]
MSCMNLKANFSANRVKPRGPQSRVCSSIGTLDFSDHREIKHLRIKTPKLEPIIDQNFLTPNMAEIESPRHLVNLLRTAGDALVVLSFYSAACGGCRALQPKICEMAAANPSAIFVNINEDRQGKLCRGLHVRVLPFFKLYRGSQGRLCSFSCTNATIGKFKDALAKHGTDRCSLGPAKGLDDEEMASLASLDLIPENYILSNYYYYY